MPNLKRSAVKTKKRGKEGLMLDWLLKKVIPYDDGSVVRDPLPMLTTTADIWRRREVLEKLVTDSAILSSKKSGGR